MRSVVRGGGSVGFGVLVVGFVNDGVVLHGSRRLFGCIRIVGWWKEDSAYFKVERIL